MSAIKDLLREEEDADTLLRDAEQRAEAILANGKAKASEILKRAESEEGQLNEMAAKSQERIARARSRILEECRGKAAEAEKLYKGNLDGAVNFVVSNVLGVDYER
jgi:vacuolar-type H+-ATPase subunit H